MRFIVAAAFVIICLVVHTTSAFPLDDGHNHVHANRLKKQTQDDQTAKSDSVTSAKQDNDPEEKSTRTVRDTDNTAVEPPVKEKKNILRLYRDVLPSAVVEENNTDIPQGRTAEINDDPKMLASIERTEQLPQTQQGSDQVKQILKRQTETPQEPPQSSEQPETVRQSRQTEDVDSQVSEGQRDEDKQPKHSESDSSKVVRQAPSAPDQTNAEPQKDIPSIDQPKNLRLIRQSLPPADQINSEATTQPQPTSFRQSRQAPKEEEDPESLRQSRQIPSATGADSVKQDSSESQEATPTASAKISPEEHASHRTARQSSSDVEQKDPAQSTKEAVRVHRQAPSKTNQTPSETNQANSETEPKQSAQIFRRYRQAPPAADQTNTAPVQEDKTKEGENKLRRIRSSIGVEDENVPRAEEKKSIRKYGDDNEEPPKEASIRRLRSIFESQEKTNTDNVSENISLVRLVRSVVAEDGAQKVMNKRETVDNTFLQDPLTNTGHYYTIIDSRLARSADQSQLYAKDSDEYIEVPKKGIVSDEEHGEGHKTRRYF